MWKNQTTQQCVMFILNTYSYSFLYFLLYLSYILYVKHWELAQYFYFPSQYKVDMPLKTLDQQFLRRRNACHTGPPVRSRKQWWKSNNPAVTLSPADRTGSGQMGDITQHFYPLSQLSQALQFIHRQCDILVSHSGPVEEM